jgi:hypothetical protein
MRRHYGRGRKEKKRKEKKRKEKGAVISIAINSIAGLGISMNSRAKASLNAT